MTSQKRPNELVNILRPDFFARYEPNASWTHYQSAIMTTCALKGFWPMSMLHNHGGSQNVHDAAVDHDLQMVNSPSLGYLSTATVTAFPPWCNFDAYHSTYLTYGADDSQHDITGTEAYVASDERGLTLGGWFKFTSVPASDFGLIAKWTTAGNHESYLLRKNATNNIVFEVTTDGSTNVTVTSAGTVTTGLWYHLYGRFDPSTDLAVFIDNVKTTNAVGTPASIFNSTATLEVARYNGGNYFDGKASMVHLNAAQLSDGIIGALWQASRVMYGK